MNPQCTAYFSVHQGYRVLTQKSKKTIKGEAIFFGGGTTLKCTLTTKAANHQSNRPTGGKQRISGEADFGMILGSPEKERHPNGTGGKPRPRYLTNTNDAETFAPTAVAEMFLSVTTAVPAPELQADTQRVVSGAGPWKGPMWGWVKIKPPGGRRC